jgi:uncharacterized protein involved in outer membrane biogenesis
MAARLNPRHSDLVRQKIQASVLIDRLTKHANGELEMSSSQIRAAEVLLDRSVPKLSQIQHTGDADNPVEFVGRIELVPLSGNGKG